MGTVTRPIPPPPPKLELIIALIVTVISPILAVLLFRNVKKQNFQPENLKQNFQPENL